MQSIFSQFRSTNLSVIRVAMLTSLFCWPLAFEDPLLLTLGIPQYLDLDGRLWSQAYELAKAGMVLGFALGMPAFRLIASSASVLQIGLVILASGQFCALIEPLSGLVLAGLGAGIGLAALLLLMMENSHHCALRMTCWLAIMGAVCLVLVPLFTPILAINQYLFLPAQHALHTITKALALLALPLALTLGLLGQLRRHPLRSIRGYVEDRFALMPVLLPLMALCILPALPTLTWHADGVIAELADLIETATALLLTLVLVVLMWRKRHAAPCGLLAGAVVALTLLASQFPPPTLLSPGGMAVLLLNASGLWLWAILSGFSLAALPYRYRVPGLLLVLLLPRLPPLLWQQLQTPDLPWQGLFHTLIP